MARLECECGFILSNSNNPEIQYQIFSDSEWLEVLDRTDEGEKLINLSINKIIMWKCSNCKRLHLFEKNNDIPVHTYKIEKSNGGDW